MKKLSYGAVSILIAAVLAMPLAASSVAPENADLESGLVEATIENVSAYASATSIASGTLSTGVNWSVYDDGVLEISGAGAIPDFTPDSRAPWYANASDITSIVVEEGITSIGTNAFRDLSGVTTAELSETLDTIGDGAFMNCTSLQSVDIKDGVTTIGNNAFDYCIKLESIVVPESVTSIGMYAFYKCYSLVSAELPSDMSEIPMGLFGGCYYLESIDWPANVETIGEEAFFGCSLLNYVQIPDTVTSIGAHAFQECVWLYTLAIGDGVTDIGADVATGSPYVTFLVNEGSVAHTYAVANGHTVAVPRAIASGICGDALSWDLYGNGDMYITGTGAMDLWTSAERAPWYEYCDDIKNVYIESGATSISAYAFYNCKNLVSIDVPSTVSTIGVYAFAYCENLKDIVLPSAVIVFNEGVFYNCKSIETLNPSSNTTSVGAYAFAGCENLTAFELGNSVKTIGTYAFYDCRSITSITIGSGCSAIGDYAFVNCTSLEEFNVSSSNTVYLADASGALLNKSGDTLIAYPAGNESEDYTIGSSVKTIKPFAFANADNLASVTLSSTVTTIGANAFHECDNLFGIEIPANVTSIGDMAFYGCRSMEMAVVNSTNVTFGEDAFYHTNEYFIIYGVEDSTAQAYAESKMHTFALISCYEGNHTPAEPVIENVDGICPEGVTYEQVVYCEWCNCELERTTVTESAKDHTFENGTCTVCGANELPEFVVIENFDLTNKTGDKAKVTAPETGWIVGENTFNVSCELVCRVYVSNDGGATYERLTATANANGGYDFTTELTAESKIEVRIFGDITGDGRILSGDIIRLRRIFNKTFSADTVTRMLSDVTEDGRILSGDIIRLRRIFNKSYTNYKW